MDCPQRRYGFRILAVLLLCLCVAGSARGASRLQIGAELVGSEEGSGGDRGLYAYVRLRVYNPTGSTMGYRVTFHSSRAQFDLEGQTVESGKERVHNLALPLTGNLTGYIAFRDSVGGDERVGITTRGSGRLRVFLQIADIEDWATEKQMQDFSKAYDNRSPSHSSSSNYVSQLEPLDLAENWLCYTPFRAVIVSQSAFNRMRPSARNALLTWVDGGGWLTVYGAAENKLERSMFGSIEYARSNPIKEGRARNEWRQAGAPWKGFYGTNRRTRERFPYAVKETEGKLGGFVLATLFFLVAGPGNFLYWRRKGRIRMLLVSLPVLSMLFCLVITGWFIVSQGFAKKGGSYSVTVLDEGTRSAFTFSRHVLFSGLYPLGGFQFSGETAMYPLEKPGRRDSFSFDLTGRSALRSGLFVPSLNFHYFTAMPHRTREKLVYDASTKTVLNGFESDMRALFFEADGKVYQAGAIPRGGKATLTEVEGTKLVDAFHRGAFASPKEAQYFPRMRGFVDVLAERGGRPRYLALLAGESDVVQGGTSMRGGNGCRILFGTMAAREE